MVRKILVAIDGSQPAGRALDSAIEEAKRWNAELHAVYVIETGLFSSLPMDNTLEVLYSLMQNEGEDILNSSREKAEAAGVGLSTHIKHGHAGNEIISLAEDLGADLIFLGSHGKSGVDRLFLGSVTEHVVRHSPVTTMVVRG
ncbi:hypothetical protein ASZ90_010634 [hydrocarbon metagenome]|uniref:UspA domain-containing protein n=1 Tax=hydrocarbon metagenome TaxID=938273 RepID=A0A0W8FFL8_9ZZZZ|nr:universal stress protein [Methanomicrobiaceae archaeon]